MLWPSPSSVCQELSIRISMAMMSFASNGEPVYRFGRRDHTTGSWGEEGSASFRLPVR